MAICCWDTICATLTGLLGKILAIGLPMFVIGYAVTFFGFRYVTALPEFSDEMLELFFTYCSPECSDDDHSRVYALQEGEFPFGGDQEGTCQPHFVWFRHLYDTLFLFTGPSVLLVRALGVPLGIQIPVASVFAFGASWLIVWTVYRVLGKKAKWIMG